MGWPLDSYPDPKHPVQRLILQRVASFCGLAEHEVAVGVDGCSVPVFGIPLERIASAYARLARPDEPALARIASACLAHPEMIGGTGRICTELMRHVSSGLIAKTGAEGGYAMALTDTGLGIAIKVEDGAMRAAWSVAVEVLSQLGVLSPEAEKSLAGFWRPPIKNFRGEVVGEIRPCFRLGSEVIRLKGRAG
jgi:L-asparaginase II